MRRLRLTFLDFECPTCGALPGAPCRNKKYRHEARPGERTRTHLARRLAAQKGTDGRKA